MTEADYGGDITADVEDENMDVKDEGAVESAVTFRNKSDQIRTEM